MEFKSIDTLSITECCEQLNLRREDLPEALQNIIAISEREQLLIERLQSLLEEDKSAIESCRTLEQYERYLSTWVDGLYHDNARRHIAQLKAEAAAEAAAAEQAFYQANKDSISGCEAYLQKYPKGKFVSEAQSTLAKKKKERKVRNTVLPVFLLLSAGFCILAFLLNANSDDNVDDLSVSTSNIEYSADGDSQRIDVSQAGKSATRLDVSTSNVEFSAAGGSRTIEVYTDGEWHISLGVNNDLGHTSISGNTITLQVEENPNASSRTDYFVIEAGSYTERINISQAGKSATRLDVSTSNVEFSAAGGNRTIEVYTDGEWHISLDVNNDLGHTSISGNTITLQVEENPNASSRTDYFVIEAGSYTERINISQAGKPATRLSVSTENVSFGKEGGSKTIEVYTDGEWRISTGTDDWGHTSISGNTITLQVDENPDASSRTDYFVIEAGSYSQRIDVSQDGRLLASYLRLSKSSIEASRDGTGYNECYPVEVDTDGESVTATTSASWIDVDVVGKRIEIETDKNTGSRRTATITVKADGQSKTIRVSQKGKSSCSNCYNWQYGYSTGQVWGVIGQYWDAYLSMWVPQYGWTRCPVCGGSGSIEN